MKATVLLPTAIAFAVMVPVTFPRANAAERDADDKAVRHRTAEFVQALESGVAKDIAGFWTSEGEYVGGDGVSVRGREALEAAYRSTMTDGGKPSVSCEIEAIRFLSRDTAVVDGLFESADEEAEEHHAAGFSILYVREDGQWRIAVLREWSRETTLADLDWLIGDWTTKVDRWRRRTGRTPPRATGSAR